MIKVRVRVTSAEAIVLDGSFRATWGQMSRGSGGGGANALHSRIKCLCVWRPLVAAS